MGQKRVTVVDLGLEEDEQQRKVSQKSAKKSVKKVLKGGKGTGRLADKSEPIETVAIKEEPIIALEAEEEVKAEKPKLTEKSEKKAKERGRRYKFARSLVDRTINYPLAKAVELVKKTSISRFDGTISAHLNLKESGLNLEVNFPHSTGKTTRVAIATDALLKQIEDKKIDFDILLASPDMMPKITKVAKIIGPLGLMPNPKNNTITADPEKRKKELELGKIQVKCESKNPLMHVVIGKTSYEDKKLIENITALINAVNARKIAKLTLAGTMSPGIKVDISEFIK